MRADCPTSAIKLPNKSQPAPASTSPSNQVSARARSVGQRQLNGTPPMGADNLLALRRVRWRRRAVSFSTLAKSAPAARVCDVGR
jgi:hypothetical protein